MTVPADMVPRRHRLSEECSDLAGQILSATVRGEEDTRSQIFSSVPVSVSTSFDRFDPLPSDFVLSSVWQGCEAAGDCASSERRRRGNQGCPATRTSQKSEGKMANCKDLSYVVEKTWF